MKLLMPWFLPVGAVVALVGTWVAFRMTHEGRARRDAWLLLALCLFPLAMWFALQSLPLE